ncbi:MAG: hypothetical protein LBP55_01975 [Candidatus Adiutrix sp.]|jgi:hypothetical protein|nr:hypothetical protein [Candidatus Adiutrix sp.]
MSQIDKGSLPSVWAEARSNMNLRHEQTNIPQIITRAEAEAITHNATGAVRRTTHEVPQVAWRDVHNPRPENKRYADLPRQNYSALAQNQAAAHPYDCLSFNYTISGKANYTPHYNPVVVDNIV